MQSAATRSVWISSYRSYHSIAYLDKSVEPTGLEQMLYNISVTGSTRSDRVLLSWSFEKHQLVNNTYNVCHYYVKEN